jgi:hypothetical protein
LEQKFEVSPQKRIGLGGEPIFDLPPCHALIDQDRHFTLQTVSGAVVPAGH